VRLPLAEALFKGLGAGLQALGLLQARGGLLLGLAVLGPLGHRQVAPRGRQGVGAEGEGELLGEAVGILQVRGQQHEAEIGLGTNHAEGEQLGLRVGADGVDRGLQAVGALSLFLRGEGGPETVVDVEKEVLDDPAFLGLEGLGGGGLAHGWRQPYSGTGPAQPRAQGFAKSD